MESLSSVHNYPRFYVIPAWMKCQFPRFEQSEGSFSNTLQTLADAVMNWNSTTASFENFAKTEFHLHRAQMPRIQGLWCFHKLIPCTMCLIPVKMAYYGTKNKLLIAFKIFWGFCRDANTYFAENPRNKWTHFKYHSGRFSYPGKKNNIPYLKDFRTGLEMG